MYCKYLRISGTVILLYTYLCLDHEHSSGSQISYVVVYVDSLFILYSSQHTVNYYKCTRSSNTSTTVKNQI